MDRRNIWIGWGPGGNAQFEEAWFAQQKDLSVWHQPDLGQDTPSACAGYFSSAHRFLQEQLETARQAGQRVHVYVHSFGLQAILAWLREGLATDFELTAIAPTLNPFSAYDNLANRHGLTQFQADHPKLGAFFEIMGTLNQDPNLLKSYWFDDQTEAYARFQKLQETIPQLNFDTFIAVIADLLKLSEAGIFLPNQPMHLPNSLPVNVILGTKDPLLNIEVEKEKWAKWFPKHRMQILECGHFPHFEVSTLHVFNDKSA